MIISGGNLKEIITSLEAKMIKQYDLATVLRLFILLSTTLSGLKQSEFDHLRRTLITCYGYQEIATLLNLQDSRLFKMRDKKMDWNKIKNVSARHCSPMLLGVPPHQRECQDRRAGGHPLRVRRNGPNLSPVA